MIMEDHVTERLPVRGIHDPLITRDVTALRHFIHGFDSFTIVAGYGNISRLLFLVSLFFMFSGCAPQSYLNGFITVLWQPS